LNIKAIPYKTTWVEYPDIAATAKSLSVPPTGERFGEPLYTLPMIHDPSAGKSITDSFEIAVYLDKTYPNKGPRLIPEGTESLHKAFIHAFSTILPASIRKHNLGLTVTIQNPRSAAFFRETRERSLGMTMEEMVLSGDALSKALDEFEVGLGTMDKWYKNEKATTLCQDEQGNDILTFADLVIGSALLWSRITWKKDSEAWKRVMGMHGGRWERLMTLLSKYEVVN
jgi:glutathione S-transferase